jgi:acetate kinase
MQGPIPVVNAGSSRIKFSGCAVHDRQELTLLLRRRPRSGVNERSDECISAPQSCVSVWAIPTDEEQTIARQTIVVHRKENPSADAAAANGPVYGKEQR